MYRNISVLLFFLVVIAWPLQSSSLSPLQTKIMASDADIGDHFSEQSVALSGSTLVVGNRANDQAGTDSGAVYIFEQNPGETNMWSQARKLTGSDTSAGDQFGQWVAISGDILVVGAYKEQTAGDFSGSAYVFYRDFGGTENWGQVQKLVPSEIATGDEFGISVAIHGDTIVIGAIGDDELATNGGAAYVFQKDADGTDNWGRVGKLFAPDGAEYDYFGQSADITLDTIVVGSPLDDDSGDWSGSAYVFGRDVGGTDNWGFVKKLTASDGAPYDSFGLSVAIDGAVILVGAEHFPLSASHVGAAYVYERDLGGAENWGQAEKLTASDSADDDYFGHSVAVSGSTAVVGAWLDDDDDDGENSGSAYLFFRDTDGQWSEVDKLVAFDAAADDRFGASVATDGNHIVVGAPHDDDLADECGSAYVTPITVVFFDGFESGDTTAWIGTP